MEKIIESIAILSILIYAFACYADPVNEIEAIVIPLVDEVEIEFIPV